MTENKGIKSYSDALAYIKEDYKMYTNHGKSWFKYFIDYHKDRSLNLHFGLGWLNIIKAFFIQFAG